MDHAVTLSWQTVFQGLAAIAVIVVVAGAILTRIRGQSGGYWIMGWGAMLMTAAFYLAANEGSVHAVRVAFVADGLFAPLMFVGAVELTRRNLVPWWPIAFGVAAGLLRVVLVEAHMHDTEAVYSAVVAPAFLSAAAVSTWRARPRFRLPIVTLLAALVIFELGDAWLDWTRQENQILWKTLIILCVPLATFQIASCLRELGDGLTSARRASDVAERQLDLERWRKEIVFERVNELVAELAEDTRILYVNGRARDMLGLDPANLIGQRAIEFVPDERRLNAEEIWRRHVKTGGLRESVLFPVEDQKGEPLYLEITVAEYELALEKRFLVIARDVTHRRLKEQERAAHEEELEQAVAERTEQLRASLSRLRDQDRLAAVGTLASGIAHQINNPVGAISAAAEFALASRDDDQAKAISLAALERIVDETRRAGQIVKSILRFARHESTVKWREDLGSVVRRSVELVRPYVMERSGALSLNSASVALPVLMSPIEIEQMMVNLIRNAAESREFGATIVVTTRVDAGRVVLEVGDDGRGIPAAERTLIFDPFHTTRLREGGSGLGLSVVHGIVKDHQGEIEIESEEGQGTCVRITLPLAVPEEPPPAD